jgi:hypothetical protein
VRGWEKVKRRERRKVEGKKANLGGVELQTKQSSSVILPGQQRRKSKHTQIIFVFFVTAFFNSSKSIFHSLASTFSVLAFSGARMGT